LRTKVALLPPLDSFSLILSRQAEAFTFPSSPAYRATWLFVLPRLIDLPLCSLFFLVLHAAVEFGFSFGSYN
jgi:hypothetical protein